MYSIYSYVDNIKEPTLDEILEANRRHWFYSGICPHTGIRIPGAFQGGLDFYGTEVPGNVIGDIGNVFNPKNKWSDCHAKDAR